MKTATLFSAIIVGALNIAASSAFAADSGLVSIFPGQTAQINIVNAGTSSLNCEFALSFIDINGAVVFSSVAPHYALGAGEAGFLTYISGSNTAIRAHIEFSSNSDNKIACTQLIPSFEIKDATSVRVLNTTFVGMNDMSGTTDNGKVKICHKPGSRAEKTMEVPVSALGGHKGHGDTEGECHSNDSQRDN